MTIQQIAKTLCSTGLCAVFGLSAVEAQTPRGPVAPKPKKEKKVAAAKPKFTPLPTFKKRSGSKARKESAGTRSDGTDVTVAVLTPEAAGHTFSSQPSFFWHQSAPSKGQVIFSLYEAGTYKPVVSKARINREFKTGINRIDLVALGGELQIGKHYQWSITYEVSRRDRSKNAVSMGSVIRLAKPGGLDAKLAAAGAGGAAAIYSAEGAWYDVLGSLDDLSKADPANAEVKSARDSLLRGAGLSKVID